MKPFLPTITAAQFKRMGKRAKIVAIAKDVIARMDANRISASAGAMFWDAPYGTSAKDLQKKINQERCEVCAKGALACAFVGSLNRYKRLDEDFELEADNKDAKGSRELVSIFGRNLWDAIEIAFEQNIFSWTAKVVKDRREQIVDSFRDITSSQERMRAIYANIADNKGRMKLKDGTFIG